ncbi:MAG TPA: aldo/keto reductase [Thermoanaerobaculia bacterium]|nr:aldo/keto reductase [Thermoanaerobaculia bacterium]
MRYRRLPGTDLELSELGFGTWTVSTGWWGSYTDAEAQRLIRTAIDRGVNYIDTADAYGNGRGETILAPILRDHPEVAVGTKFGYDFYNNPERPRGQRELPQDFSPKFVRHALEQSLRRLGTDHVAIYQPHNPRIGDLMKDELWDLMDALKSEGKILSSGPSFGPAIGWRDEGVWSIGSKRRIVPQMIYNMLEQDPGRELFLAAEIAARGASYSGIAEASEGNADKKTCEPSAAFDPSFRAWKTPALEEDGSRFLIRVTHSSGMLEGKYTLDTKFDESDHRSHRPRAWLVEGLQKVERLEPLRRELGTTIGQLALVWLWTHPAILSALPNIYGEEQIDEFAAASELPPLTSGEMEQVHELYVRGFDVTPWVESGVGSLDS